MANIIFLNGKVRGFYDAHLASQFKEARKAIQANKIDEGQKHIGKIADEILSAQKLYPDAKKDIESLEKMQGALIEQVLAVNHDATPKFMKDMPPVGIRRIGMNCWANAILQLLANAPGLRSDKLFAPLFEEYRQHQLKGATCQIDAQVLRKLSKDIEQNRDVQEDPEIATREIIDRSGLTYSLEQEVTENGITSKSLNAKGKPIVYKEPMVQLDLMSKQNAFLDLFKGFFQTSTDQKGQSKESKYQQAPSDLVIHARRFGQDSSGNFFKISKDIADIPEKFDLDPKYTLQKENAHYAVTGCIIHEGNDHQSGHYVALVKKPSGWYLVDDSSVIHLSNRSAKWYLKQGYIFHYQRTFPGMEESVQSSRCNPWKCAVAVTSAVFNYCMYTLAATTNYLSPAKKTPHKPD